MSPEMTDEDFVALATSSGSLDRSPKKNWVEKTGPGLPPYIRKIARAIHQKRGIPLDQAIPIAIGKIKDWAAGADGVTAKTKARAAKALLQWTALKGKAGAASRVSLSDTTMVFSAVHPAKEYLLDQSYQYNHGTEGRIVEYGPDSVVVEKRDPLTDTRTLESMEYVEYDGKGEYSVDYIFGDPVLLEEDTIDYEEDLTEEEQSALAAFLADQDDDQ